jgi:hypothetical protein
MKATTAIVVVAAASCLFAWRFSCLQEFTYIRTLSLLKLYLRDKDTRMYIFVPLVGTLIRRCGGDGG